MRAAADPNEFPEQLQEGLDVWQPRRLYRGLLEKEQPTVQVQTRYPGASARTLIDTVALPIEQQVNGVENMIYMKSSNTSDGRMQLDVNFEVGVDQDTANVLTQNRVSSAQARLPLAAQVAVPSPPVNAEDALSAAQRFARVRALGSRRADHRRRRRAGDLHRTQPRQGRRHQHQTRQVRQSSGGDPDDRPGPGPWVDGVIFLLLTVKDEVQVLRDIFAFCVIQMADNFQDRPRFGAGFESSCELPRNKAPIISVLF